MTRLSIIQVARLVWRIYGFAVVMALCAIIPGCNFLYSGHGGPAWFVLLAVFPFTLYRLWNNWRKTAVDSRPAAIRFSVASLLAYIPISLGLAALGAWSIERTFGLPVKSFALWTFYLFPLSTPFMGRFFGF